MSETKLSEKLQKIAQEIEGLNALELADLAKYLEEKFKISPMTMAAPSSMSSTSEAAEKKEEKTTMTVVLTNAGANKLAVIKAVREIQPNLGLMDAKKLVESAPKEILTDVSKEKAEEAKKKLADAGATVELK